MIYTPLTNKALIYAYEAHDGQIDRAGLPYILHPVAVAEQMDTEDTTVAALLHDVVENTEKTLGDLRDAGFPEHVVEAVALLTHEDGISYLDYVRNLKDNPIARTVKMADMRHNMNEDRYAGAPDSPGKKQLLALRERYRQAYRILEDA